MLLLFEEATYGGMVKNSKNNAVKISANAFFYCGCAIGNKKIDLPSVGKWYSVDDERLESLRENI